MRRFALIVFATFPCAGAAPAEALESSWVAAAQSQVRLLADRASSPALRVGIEIKLNPGWKTYWRYPGDAGVPPRIDWTGSKNFADLAFEYPAPERFVDESGSKSIGYRDNVVFFAFIRPGDPGPVKLKLKIDFAVCEKLCIPAEAELALDIPAGTVAPLTALDQAQKRLPRRIPLGSNWAGLSVVGAKLERGTPPQAIVEIMAPGAVDLFAEGPDDRWALPLPDKIDTKEGKTRFRLVIDGAPSAEPSVPAKLVLTLVTGDGAIEVETPLD